MVFALPEPFVLGAQNLKGGGYGCLDPDCDPDPDFDRFDRLAARLKPIGHSVLVLNEIRDQRPYHRGQTRPADHVRGLESDTVRMHEFAERLGMRLADITPSRSGVPSAVLYNPAQVRKIAWYDRWSTWFTSGFGVAVFAVEGLGEIAVGAIHADPWDSITTESELRRAAAIICETEKGLTGGFGRGALAGDLNCLPTYRPDYNIAEMDDHHKTNRLIGGNGPDPRPNLAPARVLDDDHARFTAAAAAVDACAPRPGESGAERIERTRTGRHARIDAVRFRPALACAITGYQRIDVDRYCSDHFGVAATCDPDQAGTRDRNRPGSTMATSGRDRKGTA